MKKIFIIGAGQLGSRHLQALKNITIPLDINVIDPSKKSLDIAKQRYDSIKIIDNNNVSYYESINDVDSLSIVDLVIIATASNVRFQATIQLLNKFSVKTIIFEKILFNNPKDYSKIHKLLKSKNVSAFVNCTMRMMYFY